GSSGRFLLDPRPEQATCHRDRAGMARLRTAGAGNRPHRWGDPPGVLGSATWPVGLSRPLVAGEWQTRRMRSSAAMTPTPPRLSGLVALVFLFACDDGSARAKDAAP